ncbi:MAG: AI-2E family transporter, partial [Blastocatellia bacterium]
MNTSESRETRQKERIWVGTQIFLRCLAILVALWIAYQVLYGLRTILLLLTLSVFFCYFIAPLVKFCENPIYLGGRELKLPRGVAILVVYLLFGGALFLVLQLVIPVIGQQASSLVKELPDYLSKWSASANKTIQGANKALHGLKVPGTSDSDLVKWATDLVASLLPKIQDTISALLSYLIYLPWLVLVPILSFFMLKDAENFSNELVSLFPNPRLQRRIHR